MASVPNISVIIPAHNEAKSIRRVLGDLPLRRLLEVIVVDNGSTDGTGDAARGFAPKVRVVEEPRLGYGQACLTGIEHLHRGTQIVVFMDGDYSDHGEEIWKVVAPIVKGRAEFVVGSRARGQIERGSMTVPQRFGNWLATRLMRLIWRARWTDLGPFRSITVEALRRIEMRDRNYGWTVEMQIKAVQRRLRVAEVPVRYRKRIGVSKISGTVSGTVKAGWKILWTIGRYALVR